MNPAPNFERFYSVFRDIVKMVYSSTSLEEVMELVVWKTTEMLNAKGAVMRLLNVETRELEISSAYGLGEKYLKKGVVSSHQVITDLCQRNKVIFIEDIRHDPRVKYPEDAWNEGIRFIMDFPLSIGTDVIGILRVYFSEARKISGEELNFIITVIEQCSCGLGKARLIEEQETKYYKLALQTDRLSALGRMAAGIAHEINNPLAGILLYSSNLAKRVPEGDPIKEGLDIIVHETIRCRKIIQELLGFSKEKEPRKEPTNINHIIEKALTILENEFRLNRIRVQKNLAENMPDILLDGNQMQQVFVNLLLNAVEAVQSNGAIHIRSLIDADAQYVIVEIEDDGPGVLESQLDRIFEPFFSTKPKGTGLGLSISYGIVRSHKGNIHVDSRPGHGARFQIEIPLIRTPDS